jgi:hypothetical protein
LVTAPGVAAATTIDSVSVEPAWLAVAVKVAVTLYVALDGGVHEQVATPDDNATDVQPAIGVPLIAKATLPVVDGVNVAVSVAA